MRRVRGGNRVAMVVVAGVIALQLLVPALALRHDRPAAFGWQMFAADGAPPVVEVVHDGGLTSTLTTREVLAEFAHYRPEIDYRDALARHVCARSPGADRVVLRDSETHEVKATQPC